jgi:hypothetical protein
MKANRVPRDPLDRYYTPDRVASGIVTALYTDGFITLGSTILEPSEGGGAFVRAVRVHRPYATIVGVDIDPTRPGMLGTKHVPISSRGRYPQNGLTYHETADFLSDSCRSRVIEYDLAIGNPPYRRAEKFVRACLPIARQTVFLLRLGFLASAKRKAFFQEHPPSSVHILTKRPSFTANGKTDGSEYAVFVWSREPTEYGPVLHWL